MSDESEKQIVQSTEMDVREWERCKANADQARGQTRMSAEERRERVRKLDEKYAKDRWETLRLEADARKKARPRTNWLAIGACIVGFIILAWIMPAGCFPSGDADFEPGRVGAGGR